MPEVIDRMIDDMEYWSPLVVANNIATICLVR